MSTSTRRIVGARSHVAIATIAIFFGACSIAAAQTTASSSSSIPPCTIDQYINPDCSEYVGYAVEPRPTMLSRPSSPKMGVSQRSH